MTGAESLLAPQILAPLMLVWVESAVKFANRILKPLCRTHRTILTRLRAARLTKALRSLVDAGSNDARRR